MISPIWLCMSGWSRSSLQSHFLSACLRKKPLSSPKRGFFPNEKSCFPSLVCFERSDTELQTKNTISCWQERSAKCKSAKLATEDLIISCIIKVACYLDCFMQAFLECIRENSWIQYMDMFHAADVAVRAGLKYCGQAKHCLNSNVSHFLWQEFQLGWKIYNLTQANPLVQMLRLIFKFLSLLFKNLSLFICCLFSFSCLPPKLNIYFNICLSWLKILYCWSHN